MNAAFGIALVTATLKRQLENWLVEQGIGAQLGADIVVSALPPDRIATGADERPQLNLFLYTLTPNTALRRSSLAFDLHYLVTAYASADYQHELLLGCVASALAGLTVSGENLRATAAQLAAREPASGWAAAAAAQAIDTNERLALAPHFLGTEEAGRLWSSLQARFRPSLAYRVSAQRGEVPQ